MERLDFARSGMAPVGILPGWQSRLTIQPGRHGVFLHKEHDLPSCDIEILLASLRRFHQWLRSLGIKLAPSTIRLCQSEERCSVEVRQPFLGLDAEATFIDDPTTTRQTIAALQQLLAVADAIDGAQAFRLELKLRDFCWYRGELLLVDILPPVLAGHRRRISVATPRDVISNLGERERTEVLEITGQPAGIGRNLLEHALAAGMPRETLEICMRHLSPGFKRRVYAYLDTSRSAEKVLTLMRRKRQPC